MGVEISHIGLNANESHVAVVYHGSDGNSLDFGYIDVRIMKEQVNACFDDPI